MAALYPFLYAGEQGSLDTVLQEVRESTAAKAAEIVELRSVIAGRDTGRLIACAEAMAARFAAGGRLLAFGNGGSATDAQELASLFLDPGAGERPLPAFCLANDTAVITALCNDIGVEVIFARQVAALAQPQDIAVGLSTSGNSENLLRGLDEATRRGLLTVGIAGYDGGKMAELDSLDYLFVARRLRCTGSRRPRPPSTTCSGNSPCGPSVMPGDRHRDRPDPGRLPGQHLPQR